MRMVTKVGCWMLGVGFVMSMIASFIAPNSEKQQMNASATEGAIRHTGDGEPMTDLNDVQRARQESLDNIRRNTARAEMRGKIDPIAVEPYSSAGYPRLVSRYGPAIGAINTDRKKAAEIAVSDHRCDGVTNSQIATQSPKVNRRYWVECENLTRFRFDEQSLAERESVSVQTIADMARDGLITD